MMIKKMLSLICLLFILGGCSHQINSTIYVLSVGFEMSENGLTTHFFINPKNELSRKDSSFELKNYNYVSNASSIPLAFNDIKNSYAADINFSHIKTYLFGTSFFNKQNINNFLLFVKSNEEITFNSYVFICDEKLNEIYKSVNPEDMSTQFSFLSSPDSIYYQDYGVKKVHLLDFANSFLNPNLFLHIPIIGSTDNWEGIKALSLFGFYAYKKSNDTLHKFLYHDYPGMTFLFSRPYLYLEAFRLYDYKVKFTNKKNKFVITLSYESITIDKGNVDEVKKYLINEIKNYINAYVSKLGNLYLISHYNYLYCKKLDELDFIVYFK